MLFAGDGRNLSGHIHPRGIVAPGVFQIAVQKMENGAVEPGLGIARFDLQRLVVQVLGHIALAFIAEKIGHVGQRQRIVGSRDQRGLVVKLGALQVAPFPPGRSQGQLQFRGFGFAGDRRNQERDGGVELAVGTQQVGQVDDGLGAAGVLGQHLAVELLGQAGLPHLAGGIAKREQDHGVVGLNRQRLLELGDGFAMPPLGGQFQARLIGKIHGSSMPKGC